MGSFLRSQMPSGLLSLFISSCPAFYQILQKKYIFSPLKQREEMWFHQLFYNFIHSCLFLLFIHINLSVQQSGFSHGVQRHCFKMFVLVISQNMKPVMQLLYRECSLYNVYADNPAVRKAISLLVHQGGWERGREEGKKMMIKFIYTFLIQKVDWAAYILKSYCSVHFNQESFWS